jgi:hypothetical protein
VTERPILFSGPMIRAILAGQKTVTRRILNPQPPAWATQVGRTMFTKPGHLSARGHHPELGSTAETSIKGRFARGDLLWVRETWMPDPPIDDTWASTEWSGCGRQAKLIPEQFRKPEYCLYAASWTGLDPRWVPSIHMYRWASRITLEVTGVTVERLQDITEEQAKAEGVTPLGPSLGADQRIAGEDRGRTHGTHPHTLALAVLWDDLNADRGFGWITNPWVWAVSFRRLTP